MLINFLLKTVAINQMIGRRAGGWRSVAAQMQAAFN
jgi:hypothetical protein